MGPEDKERERENLMFLSLCIILVIIGAYCAHFHSTLTCFQAVETCVGTAGFSVGEYAALVFAGVMSFADGKLWMKRKTGFVLPSVSV